MAVYLYNLGLAFEAIVSQYGERTALRFPAREPVSFSELNALANQMASYLREQKIGPGKVVAIFNGKSPHGFASMLACLKIGATYTNLDMTSPYDRISKILENCRPAILLNDHPDAEVARQLAREGKMRIEDTGSGDFRDHLASLNAENDGRTSLVTGVTPAYIMFTSGSTGFPKGAVMTHANVLNLVAWAGDTFGITEQDTLSNVNPIYFDNSVFDFYASLFNGAALLPMTAEEVQQPRELVRMLDEQGCTVWFSVPSLLVYLLTMKALTADTFRSVRTVIFGGEGFPKPKLKQLFALFWERIRLVNVYGPTECTCICSSYEIKAGDFENMDELAPLGNIAPNFDYEILSQEESDAHFGELCLKGPQVGLGYYRDPERTRQAFVQSTKQSDVAEIIYKTGDLVEKRADGYLYFRGRADNQIKHMGYRIELEEIEAALNQIPFVKEAGVVYRKLDNGLGQILAFVAVDAQHESTEIETFYKKQLPNYMWPKKTVIMSSLPKNSNGKLDRQQLKEMGA